MSLHKYIEKMKQMAIVFFLIFENVLINFVLLSLSLTLIITVVNKLFRRRRKFVTDFPIFCSIYSTHLNEYHRKENKKKN